MFEVIMNFQSGARFLLHHPAAPAVAGTSLVSYAEDKSSGAAAVLMGRLYYREDLVRRFPACRNHRDAAAAKLGLAVFTQHGREGLRHLEGEFALVIFDPKRRTLLLQRDPLGNYPLYWAVNDAQVYASTSLRALAGRLPKTTINRDFLASFLMFPYAGVELATEDTAFRSIRRVAPGALQAIAPHESMELLHSHDWSAHLANKTGLDREEAGKEFTRIFREAVEQRLGHGKTAAHLSGGMDSSSVVCLARDLLAGKGSTVQLATLSLVYQNPTLAPEREYIDMILNQGGPVEPHFLDGDALSSFDWFEQELPLHDEPYSGFFQIASEKMLVEKAGEVGASTILSGVGAELTTDPQPMFLADLAQRGRWIKAWRELKRRAVAKNQSLWSMLRRYVLEPLCPARLRQGLGTLLRGGFGRWPRLGLFTIPPWIQKSFARTYSMWGKALDTLRRFHQRPIENSLELSLIRNMAGEWSSWHLASPRGIHGSRPFLDPRLIGFSLSLPREVRHNPEGVKPILQSAMRGILPEPIRTRKYKRGFDDIYWCGLTRHLPQLEDMIQQSSINDLGMFDTSYLIQILREHAIGIEHSMSGGRICNSLALIAWYDQVQRHPPIPLEPNECHHVPMTKTKLLRKCVAQ